MNVYVYGFTDRILIVFIVPGEPQKGSLFISLFWKKYEFCRYKPIFLEINLNFDVSYVG